MRPERWQKIEELYHSALELDPAERLAFVREACAGDEELRREVESLLTSHEQAADFIEEPVVERATRLLGDNHSHSIVGQQVGQYRILSLLGAGGMGEVYLAEDSRLGRKVALKLLPSYFTGDKDRLSRFQLEARSVSALNHPNILTIHEIGQVDSIDFIATEFIDGETLRDRMKRTRMKLDEALEVAIQVTSALAVSHAAGIIHRDIKPENIMLRRDRIVKVLDFGLAKLIEQHSVVSAESLRTHLAKPLKGQSADSAALTLINTGIGMMMGTVQYMSPDQARGLAVDARTDIWSLGVVLYEMVAGRAPHTGETAGDVIGSILEREPPKLAGDSSDASAELERIVRKCLEKDRERRYQSVQQLLDDLKSLREGLESGAVMERSKAWRKPFTRRYSLAAVALVVTAILAALIYALVFRGPPATSRPEIKSLAVLPLKNLSGNSAQGLFADGMTETLINVLARIGALRIISHTSVMRYKGEQRSLPQIARELKVDAVVEGTVLRSGEQVRVSARLMHAPTGLQLWADSYERDLRDISALQQEVARTIAGEIRIKLTPQELARLTNARPVNAEAHEAYLKGRSYLDRRNEEAIKTAITYFNEAIAKDAGYALPYVALSEAYFALGTVYLSAMPPAEALAKGEAAALKALELDETLAEAHTALAVIKFYAREWSAAEQEFKSALELNPSYAPAHSWNAIYLAARGRLGEAIARIYRAREIDPLSPHINQNVGWILHYARQYDEAIEQYERALELDPTFLFAKLRLAGAYLEKRMFSEAISEYERAIALSNRNPATLGALGRAYALAGRRSEARQILRELMALRERKYVNPYSIVMVHVGLGEKDKAFEWLERAYQERSYAMVFLKVGTEFDPLRSDPRFQDLLRRVGFQS